jgi:phosphatidylserine/phosphatidylglycerophosphate/cardiolipin synthase-like enzyme
MTETDPEYWFLPPPALTHTIGNSVVALVDGATYMKDLYDRFSEMETGDSVFYTAWRGTPQQKLRPDLTSRDTRLQSVFLDLIRRGVIVRLLAWYVPGTLFTSRLMPVVPRLIARHFFAHNTENLLLVENLNKALKRQKGGAFLDERLPFKLASHHQKSVVLTAKGEPWAYLGGIDIALDRWDTPDHSSPPDRQRENLDAWHDVQCVIKGPAVGDIAKNFRERWNEEKPPVRFIWWDLPKPIPADLRVPNTSKGTLMVQRLRTLACNNLYEFKRGGEQTAREGINRAIEQAKYYVYIEDQYFWPCTTIEYLARAVRRGVHVFLLLAKEFDLGGLAAIAHYEMRRDALDVVRAAGSDKVICCHLEQKSSPTQIYVHSKFMIVDDRFVAIGSTNVGLRSHTTDSELHVSILDTAIDENGLMNGTKVTVCKFAQELRKRVWHEHLNVPESALHDPIAAKSHWPRQTKGSTKVHHAAYHSGEPPPEALTLLDWYALVMALRELAKEVRPWPNVTSAELELVERAANLMEKLEDQVLKEGFTDLVIDAMLGPILAAAWRKLKRPLIEFVKHKLMNVETKCGSSL